MPTRLGLWYDGAHRHIVTAGYEKSWRSGSAARQWVPAEFARCLPGEPQPVATVGP